MNADPPGPLPGGPSPGHWDVGLQPERTSLAWVRTGLALVVVSLLLGRLATGSGVAALAVSFAGLVLAATSVALAARGHDRRTAALHGGRYTVAPESALLLVCGTVVLAGAAVVLVVLP